MPRFVSLFSGAGGLDLGFEQAGFECVYASDFNTKAIETLTHNFRHSKALAAPSRAVTEVADIREQTGAGILDAVGGFRRGDIDLIVGGPPCQSWSSAGKQKGFDDPRGQLFVDYIRVADELDVRWLVFENVRGLITARGPDGEPGSALAHIRGLLFAKGFQTKVMLLNAADYGVPQRRFRVVVIGYRTGDEPPTPVQTHSKAPVEGLSPWVSLGECLVSLAPVQVDEIIRPSVKLAPQLAKLEPGTGVKSPGRPEPTRPNGHWGYKQGAFLADLALPARTVTASAQQDWVRDPEHGIRKLTPRECAAIQTFPSDWAFFGSVADIYKQIGNAVPVGLSRAVASALFQHINETGNTARHRYADLAPLPDQLAKYQTYTKVDHERNKSARVRFVSPVSLEEAA